MEDQTKVYINLSPEIQELLADNQVDLVDLLKGEGIHIERVYEQDLMLGVEEGFKEPVTIIIASAALVVALTPILTKALNRLTYKQVLVTEQVPVAAEDSQGNVLLDKIGNPIVKWVDRTKILERKGVKPAETDIRIEGVGIKITYKGFDN